MTLPPSPDPDHIAALVRRCPLVADLHPGAFGEAATYLPHRRVIGVQVRPGEIGVHITARYPASIIDVDGQLRDALADHLGGMALTITIEDYAPPSERARRDSEPTTSLSKENP